MPLRLECAPAFNYARSTHKTEVVPDSSIPHATDPCAPGSTASPHMKALFTSREADLDLDLRFVPESSLENVEEPEVELKLLDLSDKGHKGPGIVCEFTLVEGQAITWILRSPPKHTYPEEVKPSRERAEQLNVPFESLCSLSPILPQDLHFLELIMTASDLRAPEDPMLTKVISCLLYLLDAR
jgi:hypothetical protein